MFKNYIKIAFKVFLRRKFYTCISLFGISFTLTVLMITSSILDNIFGPMAPEINLNRTLGVYELRLSKVNGGVTINSPGYEFLDKYVRTLPFSERISILSESKTVIIYHDGRKSDFFLKRTDGEFWKILKFDFLEGAPFTNEDEENANYVCVINEATKEKLFKNSSAAGKYVEVERQRFRVTGVVKNVPRFRVMPFADIWAPISTSISKNYQRGMYGGFWAAVLTDDRSNFDKIKAEYQYRLKHIEIPFPKARDTANSNLETFFEYISRGIFNQGGYESFPNLFLGTIIGLMIIFMILPVINLINVTSSRMMERSSEIGVRKAFGASSRTLVGQFVVENVILTLLGGLLGFILSIFMLKIFTYGGIFKYAAFGFNSRIFLYGLVTTLFFGIVSGVYPAWKMSLMHPVTALRGEDI